MTLLYKKKILRLITKKRNPLNYNAYSYPHLYNTSFRTTSNCTLHVYTSPVQVYVNDIAFTKYYRSMEPFFKVTFQRNLHNGLYNCHLFLSFAVLIKTAAKRPFNAQTYFVVDYKAVRLPLFHPPSHSLSSSLHLSLFKK